MVGFLRKVFTRTPQSGRHMKCRGRRGHFMHVTEYGWRCCRCERTVDGGSREPDSTGACACRTVPSSRWSADVTVQIDRREVVQRRLGRHWRTNLAEVAARTRNTGIGAPAAARGRAVVRARAETGEVEAA